jgi:RNA-directed DNA polymerase
VNRRLPNRLSESNFKRVWRESRDSSPSRPGAPGIDRVTAQAFSAELLTEIRRIRLVIQRDHYQFSRLRVAPVPKASGGERIIAIPTVRDRLLQRVILDHLEGDPRFKPTSSVSYGFTKGRNLQDAQRQAVLLRDQHPWVIQADIIKFFDRVDRSILLTKLRNVVRSKIVFRLLQLAIACELDDRDPKAQSLSVENQIREGRGLRQGMPLSPMLSNILLKEFDQSISKSGLRAIRYADDIAIFCDSENECHAALSLIKAQLGKLKLQIPELSEGDKTKILGPTQIVEFLGTEIRWFPSGYRLCTPSKRLVRIEERLKEICTFEYCHKHRMTFPQALRSIESSLVGHERSVHDLDGASDFVARLNALRTKYSRKLLISIIGENAVRALSAEKRSVLGLDAFPSRPKQQPSRSL